MHATDLDPREVHELLQRQPMAIVLDVRSAPEYQRRHISDATLLPLPELVERCDELDPRAAYVVTCEHGIRSVAACEYLASRGFATLYNLRGGMAHWVACGLPVASQLR